VLSFCDDIPAPQHSREPTFRFTLCTMLGRSAAILALAGSAAAFSPMMSMDMGRREVRVQ